MDQFFSLRIQGDKLCWQHAILLMLAFCHSWVHQIPDYKPLKRQGNHPRPLLRKDIENTQSGLICSQPIWTVWANRQTGDTGEDGHCLICNSGEDVLDVVQLQTAIGLVHQGRGLCLSGSSVELIPIPCPDQAGLRAAHTSRVTASGMLRATGTTESAVHPHATGYCHRRR